MRSNTQTKRPHINPVNGQGPAFRVWNGEIITITKSALNLLGQPRNIQFWFSENNNALLIGPVEEPTPWSFEVSEYRSEKKWRMRFRRSDFINAVLRHAGWNAQTNYFVAGEYIGDLGMIAFCFDNAETEEVIENV